MVRQRNRKMNRLDFCFRTLPQCSDSLCRKESAYMLPCDAVNDKPFRIVHTIIVHSPRRPDWLHQSGARRSSTKLRSVREDRLPLPRQPILGQLEYHG